jgi:hypothetical protein
MHVEDLYKNFDFHHWREYDPWDAHYVKYYPHIILAAHKIGDVYEAFSNGRAFLSYLEVDNYGELISEHDNLHLTFIRSRLLQSALFFYNSCIDLSWQVLWLYHGESKYRYFEEPQYYYEITKECNRESLKIRLHLAMKDYINKHIDIFMGLENTVKVRSLYNYLKHRGTVFTEGLGRNASHLMGAVDGQKFKMITRENFDLSEWKARFIEFDIKFFEYFNQIIDWIMPRDFLKTEFDFFGIIDYKKKWERNY